MSADGSGGRVRAALDRVAPRGSRARASLSVGLVLARDAAHYASAARWRYRTARMPAGSEPDYGAWLEARRLSPEQLQAQRARIRDSGMATTVACLILPGLSGGAGLGATLRSLRAQTLRSWSAQVVGMPVPPALADSRIAACAGHEEAALAGLAGGDSRDFVLVLESGDVLEPDLLFNVAARGWDDPRVDVVYWDEDELGPAGATHDPRFRPAWSPETLLSANYLGRAFAVRRQRLAAAGGFTSGADDARYWRLLLALDLRESEVACVPQILQHSVRRPRVAAEAGAALVAEHLERAGRQAEVSAHGAAVRVRWRPRELPDVSIVVPTRSRETLLARCLEGLQATRYPSFEVVVVDSAEPSERAEAWYRERASAAPFALRHVRWDGPFNYSAANNLGARAAAGKLLVFLNDDTFAREPDWLEELVGWAVQPEIGLAGLQLTDGSGAIQHGGVIIGMQGFAGHLFAGMRPGEDSLFGSTHWYRNCLSVTAACVALTRELFETIGGFDERFLLCGSDVALGLDARFHGRRSVCSPHGGMQHLEAGTRGQAIPREDFFSSWWRYQRWLRGGDPYYSPALSLQSGRPRLRGPEEPDATAVVGGALNRKLAVFRQRADSAETEFLVKACRADGSVRDWVRRNQAAASTVRTVDWFLPDIDSPFYGGVNTALRIAAQLQRDHGVENRFVLLAAENEPYVRSALDAAFPVLRDSPIAFSDGRVTGNLQAMPPADVAIATQWHTAYMVANFRATGRRYYLIQDFEPCFYPAGSNYALAEETYRLGLLGICNTEHMLGLYSERYDGEGMAFMPAVDGTVFHARGRRQLAPGEPVTVFTYARPGHWRNCWELAALALRLLKRRLGDRVRILTAGSWARPDELGVGIEHLGLLDYRDTGELYRTCDVGLALTVSEHPSYLPLELLACGVPVVAFDNPAGDWILQHESNCLRAPRTADGVLAALERLVLDVELRRRLAAQGVADIAAAHGDWDSSLAGLYGYLCDPGGASRTAPA